MTIKGSHVSVLFHYAGMIPGQINSLQSKYCDNAVFFTWRRVDECIASDAPQMSRPPILQEVPPEDMSGQSECQLHPQFGIHSEPQFVENFELNTPDHCGEIMLH